MKHGRTMCTDLQYNIFPSGVGEWDVTTLMPLQLFHSQTSSIKQVPYNIGYQFGATLSLKAEHEIFLVESGLSYCSFRWSLEWSFLFLFP